MKMESLNTSLPWTLQPNKSMMMQSLRPSLTLREAILNEDGESRRESLTLREGILNEDGESRRESLLDTSAKHKYDGKPGLFTLIKGTLIEDEESP